MIRRLLWVYVLVERREYYWKQDTFTTVARSYTLDRGMWEQCSETKHQGQTEWATHSINAYLRSTVGYIVAHGNKRRGRSSYASSISEGKTVQLLSRVRLSATPWITACQASLSITNSRSPPKLMSIESVMPSNHRILCHPLLLLPSIFPSIRVFSNESVLRIRWPKDWSFSFNISPSNEQDWSLLGGTGWISLQSKGLSGVFSNTTVQKRQSFRAQLSL